MWPSIDANKVKQELEAKKISVGGFSSTVLQVIQTAITKRKPMQIHK